MSEVFDPDKVPTFQSAPFEGCFAEGGQGGCEDKGVIHVRKSDYDKLLALYREAVDGTCSKCGCRKSLHYSRGCAVNIMTFSGPDAGVRGCACTGFQP